MVFQENEGRNLICPCGAKALLNYFFPLLEYSLF